MVERLIRSVCALDYPVDRLEIQVLDDSTDETHDRAAALVEEYTDDLIEDAIAAQYGPF